MRTARTVCFVCFVLFFGTTHVQTNSTEPHSHNKTDTEQTTGIPTTCIVNPPASSGCVCPSTPSTLSTPTKPSKGDCIFFLPSENKLILVLVALVVACFILLLTTLMCACQLCHMKAMITKFKPNHNNIDLQAMRKRSESPCRDDGQAVREPTETCIMLSEVTTQEEENKEESAQPNTEPYVEGPNGEVAQESGNGCEAESKASVVEAPESSISV